MANFGEPRFPYIWEEIKRLVGTKSSVEVLPKTESGTNIADIVLDGTTIPLYAPSGGSVDTELSTTSTNPVQNKVITTALNEKVGVSQTGATETLSIANSTSFADTGVSFNLDVGVYILIASISFPSGTGRRGLRWYYGDDTTWGESAVSQDAVSGANTRLQVSRIIKVNTGITGMKIQAFQNSGSALSCDVSYRYLKFA